MATVRRQEVQGMQDAVNPNVARQSRVIDRSQTFNADTSGLDRVNNLVQSLAGFAQAADSAAFKQAQVDVETQKIKGMDMALTGGKRGEAETKAQLIGYDTVQSQADLNKANEMLANHINDNPTMSDEDLDNLKKQTYGDVLSKYQDADPDVFKALSARAQESQLPLQQIRNQSQRKYREDKAMENLNYTIGSNLDSIQTEADSQKYVGMILKQGQMSGLSEFQVKDALLNQTKQTAAAGDPRLLKAMQQTDWGKYAPETEQSSKLYQAHIKEAQAAYQAAQQKANAFQYGIMMADIETTAKAGGQPEIILDKLKKAQAAGMQVSPSMVASYLTMGKTISESQQKLQANVTTYLDGKGNFPLAQNPNIAADDKPKVLSYIEDAINNSAAQVPQDQRASWTINNLIALSNQEQMPVKTLTDGLTSLSNVDPQAPFAGSTALWATQLLSMDEQAIRRNVTDTKQQKFLFNLRDQLINQQGSDWDKAFPTAVVRAQAARDNNIPLTSQQTKKMSSRVSSQVGDINDPTASSYYFFNKGLPSQVSDNIKNDINSLAKQMYAVTGNTEKAADLAVKEYRQNNMVLTGGVQANIGVAQLVRHTPDLAQKGDNQDMVQKRAVSAMDTQLESVLKSQSKEDGIEYKKADARFMFSNSGNTYQVMVGGLVVGTYPTSGLKEFYQEDAFKKWNATQESEQTESRVAHELSNERKQTQQDTSKAFWEVYNQQPPTK